MSSVHFIILIDRGSYNLHKKWAPASNQCNPTHNLYYQTALQESYRFRVSFVFFQHIWPCWSLREWLWLIVCSVRSTCQTLRIINIWTKISFFVIFCVLWSIVEILYFYKKGPLKESQKCRLYSHCVSCPKLRLPWPLCKWLKRVPSFNIMH